MSDADLNPENDDFVVVEHDDSAEQPQGEEEEVVETEETPEPSNLKPPEPEIVEPLYQEGSILLGEFAYEIHYALAGNGPINILMLPDALGSYSIDFKRHLENFDHETFTIVAWDAPGYGRSRPPDRDNSADYHEREARLAYELMEKVGCLPFSILAHGDAGPTALFLGYEARETDDVCKMVLWGTSSYVSLKQVQAYKSNVRDTTLWAETKRRPFVQMYGEEPFVKAWEEHCAAKIDWFNDEITCGNICRDILCDIPQPVLLLYPEYDFFYSEEEMEDLEYFLPNAGMIFCEEMYHQLHTGANFNWFRDIVTAFLEADEETQFDPVHENRKALEEEYYEKKDKSFDEVDADLAVQTDK